MTGQARQAVGWVGLGVIGLPMASRLAAAGWTVWGYDPDPGRRDAARDAGIRIAAAPREIAERTGRFVVCVVRTADEVEDALLGEEGALAGRHCGIVMSSVGADAMRALYTRAREEGAELLDAPIFGNPRSAAAGELLIVVSGPADAARDAGPVFDAFAKSVVAMGEEPGDAQAMKMISQLLQIIGMAALIEGMGLAGGHGLPERGVLEVLEATEPTWATRNWEYARGLWEGRDPSTSLGLFAKDLEAAVADARAAGLDVPLTAEAARLFDERCGG